MLLGIRLKAVVLGIATAFGVTVIGMFVLFIFLIRQAGIEYVPQEESTQFFESLIQTPRFLWFGGLLDFLASVLGGYVAAKLAHVAPLLNAGCVGVVGVGLGVFFIGELPPQFELITIILTLPAALVGGQLGR